ncbi:hypothetical protein A2572_02435 [Candidatus Collierbacteria bacterium RIFOXYD1_FULL_40_9]|uniref:Uncharacterized protein n=1 Tax=Candidatus Collierbacteria bacterium RIFOXYD1_FULL_40_9 TaxID=1817731 RepID=A0A1F5FPJ7_9BACT|nr:MAG: hypothetical protein A2572_02435 [Candidatus Collierbacteria bacterium RIFOXYD1_FULL_40_9]
MPQAPENLGDTQPTKIVPRSDTPQTLEQLAETQPVRVVRSENAQTEPEIITLERLSRKSLEFLDRLAIKLVEGESGESKGYLKQTFLDFVGIPTVLSAGDVMGFLRGYLNVRKGKTVRGAAEILTAIAHGILTGPAHKLIDIIDKYLEQNSK